MKTLTRVRAPKFRIWTSKIMPDLWLVALFCPIKKKFHTPPYSTYASLTFGGLGDRWAAAIPHDSAAKLEKCSKKNSWIRSLMRPICLHISSCLPPVRRMTPEGWAWRQNFLNSTDLTTANIQNFMSENTLWNKPDCTGSVDPVSMSSCLPSSPSTLPLQKHTLGNGIL